MLAWNRKFAHGQKYHVATLRERLGQNDFESYLEHLIGRKMIDPHQLYEILSLSGQFPGGDINSPTFEYHGASVCRFIGRVCEAAEQARFLSFFMEKKADPFTKDRRGRGYDFLDHATVESRRSTLLETVPSILRFYPLRRNSVLDRVRSYAFDCTVRVVAQWVAGFGQDYRNLTDYEFELLERAIGFTTSPLQWTRLFTQCGAHIPVFNRDAKSDWQLEHKMILSHRLNLVAEATGEINGFVSDLAKCIDSYLGPVVAFSTPLHAGCVFLYRYQPQTHTVQCEMMQDAASSSDASK